MTDETTSNSDPNEILSVEEVERLLGMMSNGGLASDHPPQDTTATAATDGPPQFSLGVATQDCPIDLSVTFLSRQGLSVTLRYEEKTMNAPKVLAKDDVPLTFEVCTRPMLSRGVLSIVVNRQGVTNSSLETQDHIFRIEATVENGSLIDEQGDQYESVVQDIFDHVDVGDVIRERHYEYIASMLTRVYYRCQSQRSQGYGEVLSRGEVETLLNRMSNQS